MFVKSSKCLHKGISAEAFPEQSYIMRLLNKQCKLGNPSQEDDKMTEKNEISIKKYSPIQEDPNPLSDEGSQTNGTKPNSKQESIKKLRSKNIVQENEVTNEEENYVVATSNLKYLHGVGINAHANQINIAVTTHMPSTS
mmetsp:Transcript_3588/g.3538  ORF Transcript_3588/g.3538 Transcript_3588/m.3538 type:complete len:140 (-) Transcript_3588:2164-2583(-)|eukprot:CAMPEP_0170565818 /NCGR_PEP_ID=MMETSP0211-20121228/79430_1 /TAXON_ID=311385 /ORGANISM="Pseudokeronopsis sp., Strain OXSARD2" /LENGTH=139 /DNA_ID=CAMNT_0010886795 /DNA_START=2085 /DNA_END=2504 /DNA_ORIENTATION=-